MRDIPYLKHTLSQEIAVSLKVKINLILEGNKFDTYKERERNRDYDCQWRRKYL